jgi:hypothetical protein
MPLKLEHAVSLLAQASLCVKLSGATFALNSPDKSGSNSYYFHAPFCKELGSKITSSRLAMRF